MRENTKSLDNPVEEQRKTLIVKPKFQQKMMLEVILITFILVNTIVTVGYFLMDSMAGSFHWKETLSLTIAGIEIVGFIIIYHLNLRSSNRIAGPIYNLEGCLSEVKSGNLMTVMAVRDSDEFQEIAMQFNETAESLRSRLNKIQFLAGELREQHKGDRQIDNLINELAWFNTRTVTENCETTDTQSL